MNSTSAILSVLQPLSLSKTPSLLLSNLTSDVGAGEIGNIQGGFNAIAYVHDSDVMCVTLSADTREVISTKKVDIPKKSVIHTISYLACGSSSVLGIASDHGFQVWSHEGTRMLWFRNIDEMIGETRAVLSELVSRGISTTISTSDTDNFAQGCASCALDTYRAHISVGTSSGSVFVYSSEGEQLHCLTGTANGGDREVNNNMAPITCLAASDTFLVSSDERGCLTVYSIQESYRQTAQIVTSRYVSDDSGGFYCTALACSRAVVFAGYTNGCIRVYRADAGELLIEIAAHSRCVTGLSIHPSMNYIASCGEDQTVNLWNVPDFSAVPSLALVDLQCNVKLENAICTGVSWLKNGNLMCANYDDEQLSLLSVVTRSSVGDDQFRAMLAMTSTQAAHEYNALGSDSK